MTSFIIKQMVGSKLDSVKALEEEALAGLGFGGHPSHHYGHPGFHPHMPHPHLMHHDGHPLPPGHPGYYPYPYHPGDPNLPHHPHHPFHHGAVGGEGDKGGEEGGPTAEEQAELLEQRRLEEEARQEKHRKFEADRERVRSGVRDKYNIQKKEPEFDFSNPNAMGRKPPPQIENQQSMLPPLPGNLNEHLGKAQAMASELGGKVTGMVGQVAGDKCSIQ